jgi:hypothetical protein
VLTVEHQWFIDGHPVSLGWVEYVDLAVMDLSSFVEYMFECQVSNPVPLFSCSGNT